MSDTTATTDANTDAALSAMLNGGEVDADATASDATDTTDTDADDTDGEDALGDAGKQALDRMKAKLKVERERRIAAEEKAAAAGDADDADRVRREAETAATAKANTRIVKAEIRAASAGKLADPADALAFLNPADFEVDDDGDVDTSEIAAAIDDLLRRKPHLAAQGGASRPKPDRSQGATGKGTTSTAEQFASAIKNAL